MPPFRSATTRALSPFSRRSSDSISLNSNANSNANSMEKGRLEKLKIRQQAMERDVDGFLDKRNMRDDALMRDRAGHFLDLFMDFDKDISGDIDQIELQRLFERLGEPKTHLELKRLVRKHDSRSLGAISFPDFLVMMVELGAGHFAASADTTTTTTAEKHSNSPQKERTRSKHNSFDANSLPASSASAPLKQNRHSVSSSASPLLRAAVKKTTTTMNSDVMEKGGEKVEGKDGKEAAEEVTQGIDSVSEKEIEGADIIAKSADSENSADVNTSTQKRSSSSSSLTRRTRSNANAREKSATDRISRKAAEPEANHSHGIACLGGLLHDDGEAGGHKHDHKHEPPHVGPVHSHSHSHDHEHDHEHTAEELARMSNSELLRDRAFHEAHGIVEGSTAVGAKSDLNSTKRLDLAKLERDLNRRQEKLKQRESQYDKRERRSKDKRRKLKNLQEDLEAFEKILKQRHRKIDQALLQISDAAERERLASLAPLDPMNDEILRNYDELHVVRAQQIVKRWVLQRRARRLMDLVGRVRASDDAVTKQARRRNAVVQEIFTSERSYVESLRACIELFYKPLELEINSAVHSKQDPLLSRYELNMIFGDLEILFLLNREFLKELDININDKSLTAAKSHVSDAFLRLAPLLQLYNRYVSNYDNAIKMLSDLRTTRPMFATWLDSTQNERDPAKRDLGSYLIMPVQRPMRYNMLLEEVIKQTPEDHIDLENLKAALKLVSTTVTGINEHKRSKDEDDAFAKQLASEQVQRGPRRLLGKGSTMLDLKSGYAGKLSVQVLRARNLLAMDSNGKSDPFVVLQLGDQQRKTKVIKKTLNPEWEESFALVVPSIDSELVIEVYDWDRVGSDDFIGHHFFKMKDFAEESSTGWYPLVTKEGADAGEINVAVSFKA